ncbi:MAG: patatin-like phospholipase family protein [Chloroflexota bacterium]
MTNPAEIFPNIDLSTTALEQLNIAKGDYLYRRDDPAEQIFFLLNGELTILEGTTEADRVVIDHVEPSESVGEMGLISGGKRHYSVQASVDSELVALSLATFEALGQEHPELVQTAVRFIQRRTEQSQFLQALQKLFPEDSAAVFDLLEPELQWHHLEDGDWLDVQAGLYILVNGRLQSLIDGEVRNEIEPGQTIGETVMIAGGQDETCYQALYESTLAYLTPSLFKKLTASHPTTFHILASNAINQLRAVVSNTFDADALITVAVVPLGQSERIFTFCQRLEKCLSRYGTSLHLTSSQVDTASEQAAWSQTTQTDPWNIRLRAWLDEQEANHRFVIYQTDSEVTPWTRRAILRAEYILLVGESDGDPGLTAIEAQLITEKALETVRRRILVLLHSDAEKAPSGTQRWLAQRNMEDVYHVRWNLSGDVARIGRFLSGNSVGVVLGGGGARGFAHIGILKGLEELGIPIDFIGGTSVGGMTAAAYAFVTDTERLYQATHKAFIEDNPYTAYTLPLMAVLKPDGIDKVYKDFWGDTDISDLWLPYFSIGANITSAEMVVQRTGKVWESVRITKSLPGVVLPFIRDNQLYIDGGVIDNVPAKTMHKLNRGPIITIDISPDTDLSTEFSYEHLPSPWRILQHRYSPFRQTLNTFSIGDIMVRSLIINSIQHKAHAKQFSDVWLHPDCQDVGLLELTQEAMDKLIAVGHTHVYEHKEELLALIA